MTTTKTIFIAALTAILAVTITTSAYAISHPLAVSATVTQNGTYTVNITADGPVITGGSGDDYGYAVFGDKGALAITTHPDAVDSVAQPPAEAFHTHLVTVEATDDCESGLAVKTATKNEVGKLSIDGTNITVTNIPAGLTGKLTNHVVSFDLSLENGRVCVNPTGEINP